jgi:hypothetical protein
MTLAKVIAAQGLSLSARFDRYNRELEVHSFTSQRRSPRLDLRSEKRKLYPRADLATLGCAISLMTPASVSLADCFVAFPLPSSTHDFKGPAVFGQFDQSISM